jgi:L-methionine (R)-S-oxide reductase
MPVEKSERYARARERIFALCEGESDEIALMASIVTVLHHEMADFFWTGFYRVIDGGLVIGPYQGPVGCLRIAFGKGVCGMAAQTEESQVVQDVHRFPGHISCDARSKSEIVVPVKNREGKLIGVLDIDSEKKGAFDDNDRDALEGILRTIWQS